jgi:hypothetical protein
MPKYFRIALLASLFAGVWTVNAQESNTCKQGCDTDKRQCRVDADAKTNIDSNPPILFDTATDALDKRRDMRSILDDKQRREDSTKKLRFERYDECNRLYMQCISSCNKEVDVEPTKPKLPR